MRSTGTYALGGVAIALWAGAIGCLAFTLAPDHLPGTVTTVVALAAVVVTLMFDRRWAAANFLDMFDSYLHERLVPQPSNGGRPRGAVPDGAYWSVYSDIANDVLAENDPDGGATPVQ